MKLQGKHSLMLAAVLAIAATSSAQAEDVTVKLEDGSDWTISITPNPSAVEGKPSTYSATYRSIPFSRAEYDANKSYRHEATMEFLFDQLRPGTKVTIQGAVDVDSNVRRVQPVRGGFDPIMGYFPLYHRSRVLRQVP